MQRDIGVSRRLVRAEAAFCIAWHQALQELPDNPYGVERRLLGRAFGLCIHAVPLSHYNRLLGIRGDRPETITEAIEYFHSRFIPFRIDVDPFDAGVSLLDKLATAGFRPTSFQTHLYARPIPLPSCWSRGIRVREIARSDAEEFSELFDDAYYAGRSSPSGLKEFRRAGVRARIGRPGWHFYQASVGGRTAGGAVLHVQDGIATLAGGATVPAMRGRGVQTALLNHRLGEAAMYAAELVVSRCEVGTVSERNVERVGLRTAYTKIIYEHGWSLTRTPPNRGTEGKAGMAVPAFPLVSSLATSVRSQAERSTRR